MHGQQRNDCWRVGQDEQAVTLRLNIDIQENLYAGWNIRCHDVDVSFENGIPYSLRQNGSAFGRHPAQGSFPGQEPVEGYQGDRLVNTKRRNLGTFIGELISDPLIIKSDCIEFLIGGGSFGLPTSLNLLVDDGTGGFLRVREATGNNSNCLERKCWDVSEFKGRQAVLQIIDDVAIEPFGTPSWPDDYFGYILVDDIRQTDFNGIQVDPADDRARNFDFEMVKTARYAIWQHSVIQEGAQARMTYLVTESGQTIGTLCHILKEERLDDNLYRHDHEWLYRGQTIDGVKFEITQQIPIGADRCQYYLVPGLLYNGNDIGDCSHYLNEDLPEDAATLPAGFSIEDENHVFGGWVMPQQNADDLLTSVRIQQNKQENCWEAVYSLPCSAQFGRKYDLDMDLRLTLRDGYRLRKQFFAYQGRKSCYSYITNEKTGYGQVVQAAWKQLYPLSPTNPPHSLSRDYRLKLDTLLDPLCLMQDVAMPERTYRIWFVGRWLMGDDFKFTDDLVPSEYFHRYTGFSWSGMLEIACYNCFKEYLRTGNSIAYRVAEDTLDFFADHGMSPAGILYPAYYSSDFFGSRQGFGSFAGYQEIDMAHLAEGLNQYIICYTLLKENAIADKTNWLAVVCSSLDAIMDRFPDGDVVGRINALTGEPAFRKVSAIYWNDSTYKQVQWRRESVLYEKPSLGGASGLCFLVWPYVSWYRLTGDRSYLKYAELIGEHVLGILHRYGRFCGMEVDYFNIDKRMGHGALAAFNNLYEATGNQRWLEAAIQSAHWFATWQYAFNVNFALNAGTPLQVFDYRTIGGTPVDVKYSSNNICFQQGATEFMRLWKTTLDPVWFERARALLHQGLQNTLTDDKRQWLNTNYQGPAHPIMASFNPATAFDRHVLGGGTEDVICAWPFKGHWTSKHAGIISLYMLAEGFDSDDLLAKFGSLTWHAGHDFLGALDTLDALSSRQESVRTTISARNMLDSCETYRLRIMDRVNESVFVDGILFSPSEIADGIPLYFKARETRDIEIKWPNG